MPSSSAKLAPEPDEPEILIAELLARHLPELKEFLRKRAGPAIRAKESCSDLGQSVCLEILTELDRFEYHGEAAFKQWLYSTARRKLIDRARFWNAQRRTPEREVAELPDEDPGLCSTQTPSRILISRESVDEIGTAFDRLPSAYRQIIMLSRICNVPRSEIARLLGRSEAAVTALLFRALSRLSFLLTRTTS